MLRNLKKKKKGFTLIELIIVIAIIAIISAIAIPKLLNSKDDANKKADMANAKTIANAAAVELTNDKLTLPAKNADGTAGTSSSKIDTTAPTTNGGIVALGLQSIPKPKTATSSDFYIVIGSDSSIKVTIGTGATAVEAYPNTAALN